VHRILNRAIMTSTVRQYNVNACDPLLRELCLPKQFANLIEKLSRGRTGPIREVRQFGLMTVLSCLYAIQ